MPIDYRHPSKTPFCGGRLHLNIPVLVPNPGISLYGTNTESLRLEASPLSPEPHTMPTVGSRRPSGTRALIALTAASKPAGIFAKGAILVVVSARRDSDRPATAKMFKHVTKPGRLVRMPLGETSLKGVFKYIHICFQVYRKVCT
jgi:hypothetical protein